MIHDWPQDAAWTPMSGTFRLTAIAALSTSPYTGAHKAASLAQIWVAKLAWNNRALDDTHNIQGFLDQLEGPVNPVRLFDWWRAAPVLLSGGSQSWSDGTFFTDGTGWADGYAPAIIVAAARGERSIVVSGLPASTECFRRGDLIGVADGLYEVRAGVTSNAAGEALILIQPGLRAVIAVGDTVSLYRPTLAMRLASDAEAAINRAFHWGEGFSLTFVEDIP